MNISLQTNFDAVREAYAPVFDALERALQKFDIDFYLIGAQSRDVWTNHLDIEKRITRDIDYCVLVEDRATWDRLNEYLIENERFQRDKDAAHRFYLGEQTIDIIPFGGIQKGYDVQLDNPPIEVSVFGCREVAEDAEQTASGFKVVTLPGLCILKAVAYSEKPGRVKDWDDLLLITNNYSDIAGEQLFDGNYEDLLDGSFDMKLAAARMLGRHMNDTLNKNEELKDTVLKLLNSKLMRFGVEQIDQMYGVRDRDDTQVKTLKLISELIKGIND